VKTAFNREFRNKAGGYYGNNTVTANLLPMYFGLATVDSTDRVIRHIVDKIETEDHGHISTGVIGTQWLMRGLTEYGHVGVALQIAANKTYPGWGYMVEHGATTIWELWNGDSADPEMNSRNHVMLLGDLLTWCWQDLAGIKPMEAGFRTIFMHPYFPDSLSFVEASYRTPYGLVKSAWRRKDGVISWDISVPPNSRAVVAIPGEGESMVGSGQYHFNINKQ
jgi:alpha-L-rhamnosidase